VSDSTERGRAEMGSAREQIDRIDGEPVRLLNERAQEVRKIGEVKHRLGIPVYQPDREEEVFIRIVEANPGPLDNGAIRRLFERIIDEARRLERLVSKDDENE